MKVLEKKYLLPFILVTSLFALWGLANNMTDTLLAAFKKIMQMSDTQTSFIQMAFYGAYFCVGPCQLHCSYASTAIRKASYWDCCSMRQEPYSSCLQPVPPAMPSIW